jgi:hypothetical protein
MALALVTLLDRSESCTGGPLVDAQNVAARVCVADRRIKLSVTRMNALRDTGTSEEWREQMPNVAKGLSAQRLRELARAGAEQAVKQLRAEIIAIERAFPELKLPQARRAVRQSVSAATRRTRRMSAAARKAVSARMKRYWAERRKAHAKIK